VSLQALILGGIKKKTNRVRGTNPIMETGDRENVGGFDPGECEEN